MIIKSSIIKYHQRRIPYALEHHDIANTAQTACNAFTSGDTSETVTTTRTPAVLITFNAIKGLDE